MKLKIFPLFLSAVLLCSCEIKEPVQTREPVTPGTDYVITVPSLQTVETLAPTETDNSDTSADISQTDTVTTVQTEPVQTDEPITVQFTSDLSAYEKYMNPSDRDAYLILVNPANPLSEDYIPSDLTDLADTRKDGRATQQMSLYAAKSLEAFLIEARANGCKDITVTSAYRSYSRQGYLFGVYTEEEMANDKKLTRAEAEAIVLTYSCRAGTSEHQSGLCCDMHNLGSAQVSFAKKPEAKWLAENAWKFGFILRFPEDKTEQTGISYEPWHFRFVGRYHAKKMYELNMCLEEYVKFVKGE